MVQQGFRIVDQHLGQPPLQRSGRFCRDTRRLTNEITWLVQPDRKPQPGLIDVIGVVHVMAVIPVSLFQAQAAQGL